MQDDPLWRLRHALALLLSLPIAALIARVVGDRLADSYALRAALYAALLLHVVFGAAVLFVRVAQHETRPLRPARLLLWLASLWLWPLLLAGRGGRPPPNPPPQPPGA